MALCHSETAQFCTSACCFYWFFFNMQTLLMFYTAIKKNDYKNWWAAEIDWKQSNSSLSVAQAKVTSEDFRYRLNKFRKIKGEPISVFHLGAKKSLSETGRRPWFGITQIILDSNSPSNPVRSAQVSTRIEVNQNVAQIHGKGSLASWQPAQTTDL